MGPDSRHLSAWSVVSAKRLEIPKEAFDATQTARHTCCPSVILSQRLHMHSSLLKPEMSPCSFLELPKSQSQRNLQLGHVC